MKRMRRGCPAALLFASLPYVHHSSLAWPTHPHPDYGATLPFTTHCLLLPLLPLLLLPLLVLLSLLLQGGDLGRQKGCDSG
jgi:hypothetical protein